MTNEEKWALHRRAEDQNHKLYSNAIMHSMSLDQHSTFNKLCDKYGINVDIMLKTYKMYGTALIKLAIRTPSMTDDEAEFIKYLFYNHMYKIKVYHRTVRI